MTGGAYSRRNNKPSINYKYNPHGGATFDLVDVTPVDYAPGSHNNTKKPANQAEARSSILSTAHVISGAGQLWNFATSSLPVLRHRTTQTQNTEILQKENTLYYPAEEGNIIASISSEGQSLSVNLKANSHFSPAVNVQEDLDFIHVTKKIGCFSETYIYHHLLRCMHTDSGRTVLSSNEKRVSSVLISDELQNIYGWMNTIQTLRPTYNDGETISVERSDPDNTTILDNGMAAKNDVCYNGLAENQESLPNENTKNMIKRNPEVMSLHSDYLLQQESQHEKEDSLFEKKEDQEGQSPNQENSVVQLFSSPSYKSQYGLAKQEHAFAGAFAGTFVSLCLHPMDTVKTVVQSCHTDQRSIPYISKSIISERGLLGLYRGIASNIASSAPISAIYTFSYESVKAALLPLFAKEYHSLAHCVAGGCASVATSFVFTPSERIKQQMQVGSHYQSCWNALLGIVGKGGFLSLYNGWGAVLCRNVPHSIIKFYTYESLKNVFFTLNEANGQPTTISTLLCGGLAGSTAAFFTTPFDVVKTRLQTQIPGSANRYNGVYNTLRDIAQHEGLQGLYRGLTPRLIMYMTQGALFFASYESFKRLFSLEATRLESTSKGL
ncbi:hypothetical protein SSX86_009350 [Deinandra increscens subsp. villosa]|uniref:Mitochondrial substrate carrier family protein n=1 Tax=Deinandra increscens subsp. villosa TaxID=3103831 RepID=A0AAP0H4S6_9ASTR